MAVQIPFPLPSHGFAQNSKMRVNLDFLVDTFNQFNTGTATWDTVAVGVPNNSTGTVTFYNSANANYLTLQAGATAANITYTLPITAPIDNSVLTANHLGVWSWNAGPTLNSLNTGSLIDTGTATFYSGIRIFNVATGYASSLTNAFGAPASADLAWSLPTTLGNANDVLIVNGSGAMSWVAVSTISGAASKALNNLASVAVNTALLPVSTVAALDIGSNSKLWSTVYAVNFQAGTNAVGGSLSVFAPGASGGYITLQCNTSSSGNNLTLINDPLSNSWTYTFPDAGASAKFVMTEGTQTINGQKTISNFIGTGVIHLNDGSNTTPSMNFVNDTNNGFFLVSPDVWSAAAGGTEVFRFKTTGVEINGNFDSTTAGKTISMVGSTSGKLTLAAGATTTPYTFKFPETAGTIDYILRTNGSGVTSWVSISSAGGANNTLSNLSDTVAVAINENLNNFSAGTITASLTGVASGNLALTAGSGQELSGDLYIAQAKHIVFHDSGLARFLQVAMPATSSNWTMTLPTNHGTTGQILVDSDGAGTLGWAAAAAGTVNSGTASRLALYATSTTAVSDTYVQNTKNINVIIAGHPSLAANRTYTISEAGADSTFLMTNGSYTAPGSFSFGTVWISSAFGFSGATDVSITRTLPASSKSYNIPDAGANCDFVMAAGTQSIGGVKSFTGQISAGASTNGTNTLHGGSSLAAVDIRYQSGTETRGLNITNLEPGGYGSGIVFVSKRSDGGQAEVIAGQIGTVGTGAWSSNTTTNTELIFKSVFHNTLTTLLTLSPAGGSFYAAGNGDNLDLNGSSAGSVNIRLAPTTASVNAAYIRGSASSGGTRTNIELLTAGATQLKIDGDTGAIAVAGAMTYTGAVIYPPVFLSNAGTTPSVSGGSFFAIDNSSPTTITNFIDGRAGQIIYLFFSDSNTTVNRSNCYLSGGANFVSTASDMLVLIKVDVFWFEISRSANS